MLDRRRPGFQQTSRPTERPTGSDRTASCSCPSRPPKRRSIRLRDSPSSNRKPNSACQARSMRMVRGGQENCCARGLPMRSMSTAKRAGGRGRPEDIATPWMPVGAAGRYGDYAASLAHVWRKSYGGRRLLLSRPMRCKAHSASSFGRIDSRVQVRDGPPDRPDLAANLSGNYEVPPLPVSLRHRTVGQELWRVSWLAVARTARKCLPPWKT